MALITFVFVLMLVSGLVSALLTAVAWHHRSSPIVRPFLFLMAAETLWIFGDILYITGPGLPATVLITDIEYPGIMAVPIAWLFLVLVYTGRGHLLTRRTVPLFFIVPAIVWFLVLTNPLHHLYYSGFVPQTTDGTTIWLFVHGPLFWIHIAYCYLLGIAALTLAAGRLFGPTELYRRQTLILTLAATIPLVFNIAYIFGIISYPGFDLTAVGFLASGVLMAVGILRFQLFTTVPVAYSRIFSMMGDGLIVADQRNRVTDLNPAAAQVTGIPSGSAVGMSIGQVVPELAPEQAGDVPSAPYHLEIRRSGPGGERYYDVLVTPMDSEPDRSGGYLCILRDITDRKAAELALAEANRKIGLLTSITRHDITNKILGVHSYLDLIRERATDPLQIGYLAKQEQAIKAMNEQIAFTREYQQLGSRAPVWQDIRDVIRNAGKHLDTGKVTVQIPEGPYEIYADPMLEKVFYNLCDNALQYGGENLSAISITAEPEDRDLVIAIQDNGAGIADDDRPYLFRQGFGKHTGLGLFLSREILAITGITIHEAGKEGSGARFEIRVPAGKFRKSTG
jgi:PAS domain S-box-containing protein